jgi:hypothetical protein
VQSSEKNKTKQSFGILACLLGRPAECALVADTAGYLPEKTRKRLSTFVMAVSQLKLLLFVLTSTGFLPGGSGTTVRHNTKIHISHKCSTTLKQNAAHKATPTIKDTLHTMSTTRRK